MQHAVFAAFFVVQHELHGDARAVRPARVRHVAAVAGPVAARARLEGVPEAKLDYLALVDPSSFELIDDSFTGRALMLIAAVVGSTRLIDNLTIDFQEPFA